MQTIDITDFWIDRPYCGSTKDFSILSDKWCSLNNCTIGNGKAYYYNGLVDKHQLKCIVIDDTFYFDFSANSITDVIKQQIWILKHTKGIEYKIEFVCLWEMFKLPTVEQLNEFAKIKQETIIPQSTVRPTQAEYDTAIEEMRLSTYLGEASQLRNIHLPFSDYIDLMRSMSHTRLSNQEVIRYATIIHSYHNPVVESVITTEEVREMMTELPVVNQEPDEQQYRDALDVLIEVSGMDESTIFPELAEELSTYITSINQLVDEDQDINYQDVTRHATIVYNYHRSTQPILADVDHPF